MIRTLAKVFGTLIILNILVISGLVFFTPGIQGSGVLVTKTFDIDRFDHVTLEVVGTARITTEKSPFVEITADDNVFPAIKVDVDSGNLIIRATDEIHPSVMLLTIHTPYLAGIELAGDPTVEVPDLAGGTFTIGIRGHGTADVSGEVDRLDVKITGNGFVRAKDLVANEAEVNIEGAGDVEVHTMMRLAVNCTGSGKVRYSGDPQLDSQCDGSVEPMR